MPQPILEPDERIDVEVVGRFVKEQEVCRAHEGASERDAVAPAARKIIDKPLAVGLREAEAGKNRARFGGDGAFVHFRELRMGGRKRHFVAPGFRGGERRACGNKRRMAGKNEFERRHVLGDKALRNVRNALGRRRLDFAVFGREVAENGGKKRRFAAAVRTDEPDALAGRCGEIGALVEQARAAHEREVLQTKHRWRSQSK